MYYGRIGENRVCSYYEREKSDNYTNYDISLRKLRLYSSGD